MGACKRCGRSAGFGNELCRQCWAASFAPAPTPQSSMSAQESTQVPLHTPSQSATPGDPVGDSSSIRCAYCLADIPALARKCMHCGEWVQASASSMSPPTHAHHADSAGSALIPFGALLILIGGVGLLLASAMDTSVSTNLLSGERMHNLGLMNEKQNRLIIAGVIAIAGVILAAAGALKSK